MAPWIFSLIALFGVSLLLAQPTPAPTQQTLSDEAYEGGGPDDENEDEEDQDVIIMEEDDDDSPQN